MKINLKTEKTWITFLEGGFQEVWHSVDDKNGEQLDFNESAINFCKANFDSKFGISPTSQMILGNASINNF